MAILERLRLRIASLGARHGPSRRVYRGNAFAVHFRRWRMDGADYFLPAYALHRPAAQAVLAGRRYEPETHAFVARLFAVVPGSMIHAGTFFGDMLPDFSRAVQGTVHAFEPVLENYVLARLCVDANGLGNVRLLHAALSSAAGNVRIATGGADGRHLGGASGIAGEGHLCMALPIDQFEYDALQLIQLDVEGHELPALEGARATIARHRPLIAIEDNAGACAPLLESLGYRKAAEWTELAVWAPSERADFASVLG